MSFTRQIKLKIAFLLRRRELLSLIVALTSLICGLLVSTSLTAGCGDYIILTRGIPAQPRAWHFAEQEMMLRQIPRDLSNKHRRGLLFTPRVPQPCHGPSCGQSRSPAMATTVPSPTDNQINLIGTRDSASQRKSHVGRFSLASQPLLSSDQSARIDRPPRV